MAKKKIKYEVTLDVKKVLSNFGKEIDIKQEAERKMGELNKSKLLPIVCKYLHYLTELSNSTLIKSYSGYDNVRPTGLHNNILNVNEVIEKYTQDCFFTKNFTRWECNIFHFMMKHDKPYIYLLKDGNDYNIEDNRQTYGTVERYITICAEILMEYTKRKQ